MKSIRLLNSRLLVFALFSASICLPLQAQSIISYGDFKNLKWSSFKKSLDFELYYTNDYLSSTGGEKAGPRNVGALDLYLTSNFNKFSGINGEFMVHFTHVNGHSSSAGIGDTQGSSNIETPSQIDRMTDLWYQQSWSDKYKSLIGIHDISTEFNVTDSSLNFLNSSFGTTTELSVSGQNGASIYPITSLGFKNEFQFNEDIKLLAAIYDANPGDETTYRSFHSDVGNNEGYLLISELNFENGNKKIGVGGWSYSNKVSKYLDEEQKSVSSGLYSIFQTNLTEHIRGFFRYGWANPKVSMVQSNAVFGAVYEGLFQTKKLHDELGLGVSSAKFSGNHRKDLENPEEANTQLAETVVEAYYQFRAHKVLQLRPDIQYIQNPAGLKNLDNAWSFGLRSVIQL